MSTETMYESLEPRRLLSGSSFFVATTGSNAAAGTIAHPFRTLSTPWTWPRRPQWEVAPL